VDQANNSRLWAAVDTEKRQCVGYLMFGGRFPTLRIFQLFVSKKFRKKGIGSFLLSEFETYAEKNNYTSINAEVAADLATRGKSSVATASRNLR
jgi:GNAT superfamily N-acetyltransferase